MEQGADYMSATEALFNADDPLQCDGHSYTTKQEGYES